MGSTGSIGTQALEIIDAFPELLEVEALTAYANADLLISQAKKFKPNAVVIVKEEAYETVKSALWNEDIKVFAGIQSLCDIVEMSSIDIVLNALVGFSGLQPTLNALNHEKAVALANKETLVAGGSLVMQAAAEHKTPIFPVNSLLSGIVVCGS